MTLSTMPYCDQPFEYRLQGAMGETSEKIFVKVAESCGCIVERSGADKSRFDRRGMNRDLRYQPDFLIQTPDKRFFQVEVKGGNSDIVKLKLASIEAARFWHDLTPLCFFFANTSTNGFSILSLPEAEQTVHKDGVTIVRYEEDGNRYYAIPNELLFWRSIDAPLLQLSQHTGQAAKGTLP